LDRFGIRSIDSKTIPVQGFAERLSSYLHEYTKYNGRIDQTAGINGTLSQQIRSINREITNWAKRLETRYVSLWGRFSRLEKNLANMQRQSEYMANAFQQLSGRNQS
jgi:flagellar hook-associated protein 2